MRHFLTRFSERVPPLIALARSHIENNSSNFITPLPVVSLRHISATRTSRYSEASETVLASTNEADISAPQSNGATADELGMEALIPPKVVEMLDCYIVGQSEAKRAVGVALRNRWRRHGIPASLRTEIVPKNILMIGPTGCGKTEIARRLTKLADAPFVKVEATKFTEVGFHGRDVDQIIRDRVDNTILLQRQKVRARVVKLVEPNVENRILDVLIGEQPTIEGETPPADTLEIFRKLYREGAIDDRKIRLDIPNGRVRLPVDIVSGGGYAVNEFLYRSAPQKYIFSRPISTTSEESVSGPGKDEKDKNPVVVENLEAPRASGRTWIERLLPKSLQPFALLARLDRPIGTWLLVWPCFWSISLAAPSGSLPDFKMMCLFGAGAVLLRGAGCTVNDLLDSDIDGKVERTRQRPLSSGALTTFQGIGFLACQLSLGLGILLQLNNFSQVLGASSLLLVGTYPLMKRWTFWPQAFLGLTFNWGALLGWAAVHGGLDLSVLLPLYVAGVSWTLVYDTIYAHQDKEDDMKVGVKSTALLFGDETRTWLAGFSTACVSGLTLAGINADLGWPFYTGLIAAAGHLAWQVYTVDISNPTDCNSKFVSNKWFGAFVCCAIVAGKLPT